MTIEQIKVGFDNFCYLIYDQKTKNTAIVDPGYDASKIIDIISNKNLQLQYIINTHYHSDHTNGNPQIKKQYPKSQIVSSEKDGKHLRYSIDYFVSDKEIIKVGEVELEFFLTPGHTQGGLCIIVDNEAIITGDTLFIGDCGRTDLTGGDIKQMYETLQQIIMKLPNHLIVYPGHDYGLKPYDTLGNQKKTNKTLLASTLLDLKKVP